ncbi:hypothetical protein [Rhodococcus ruber]|uniref:hypothetical protein n=1 Tax=Rhodococcus ruber TaxID=1830 RepID=UPI001F1BD2FA|nr:hypothetical protein [Rhodococcus ruber]MCF8786882.1 hypothetical protein [Rhodococcus ruber]
MHNPSSGSTSDVADDPLFPVAQAAAYRYLAPRLTQWTPVYEQVVLFAEAAVAAFAAARGAAQSVEEQGS